MIPGYYDIHCHILPGIDDGAADMEETIKMLSVAYEEGIRHILATPHFTVERRNASPEKMYELVEAVQQAALDISGDFHIYPGQEILFCQDIIHELKSGRAITLNHTRYILIEFLPSNSLREIRNGLYLCIQSGYFPILAHVERYEELRNRPDRIGDLINLGGYIQMNLSSLLGHFGWSGFCHELLKKEWVHFIGTDAHSSKRRSPRVRKAVAILKKKYGEEITEKLLLRNPAAMLDNKYLE